MSILRIRPPVLAVAAVGVLVALVLGLGGHDAKARADGTPAAPAPNVTAQPYDTMWN